MKWKQIGFCSMVLILMITILALPPPAKASVGAVNTDGTSAASGINTNMGQGRHSQEGMVGNCHNQIVQAICAVSF